MVQGLYQSYYILTRIEPVVLVQLSNMSTVIPEFDVSDLHLGTNVFEGKLEVHYLKYFV